MTTTEYELLPQVERVERWAIQRALEATDGNRKRAAQLLGIALRTLFYKMARLQITGARAEAEAAPSAAAP